MSKYMGRCSCYGMNKKRLKKKETFLKFITKNDKMLSIRTNVRNIFWEQVYGGCFFCLADV